MKDLRNFFLNGFALANKNLDIFLIWLLLNFIILIPTFLGTQSQLVSFLTIPLTLIGFAFWFSIPLFLIQKQQNKSTNYRELLKTTLQNAKRLIIPAIIFIVLFAVLAFVFIIVAAVTVAKSEGNAGQITLQNMTQSLLRWNPIMLLFAGLFSLLVFIPIYFSIENRGFFSSIKKSVAFSFKNLSYVAVVFLLYVIFYSLASLIPVSAEFPPTTGYKLNILIRIIIGGYLIGFVVMASSLLYYQDKNKFVEKA